MSNSHEAFAVPASKRSCDKQSYSGAPLVILCGEGRFAKQTMERSDCCEPKAALRKRAVLARASEEPEFF